MLVTFLTDFGTQDYFVGAMKGALLAVCPQATIVDLTHELPPHDIEAGAYTLLAAYDAFPPATVHVGVVDPGVGSARRPLIVATRDYLFVGPDNGLFSYVCEREPAARVFHLTNLTHARAMVSHTFHGRDLFAPVAGVLAQGVAPETLGTLITDYVRLAPLAPTLTATGALDARIIHVDRFGNCVTNITRRELPEAACARGVRVRVGPEEVRSFRRYFGAGAAPDRTPFAIWGSAGFLEIAVACGSAAHALGVARGAAVRVDSVGPE